MRIRTVGRIMASLALALALATPAAAQGTAGPGTGLGGGLFGAGVSFLRTPDGDESETFKGFAVDFRKNVYAATSVDIGVVGDLGWHRFSEDFEGFDASLSVLTLMGGVRATASQLDRVAPFGQFLVGLANLREGGDICDELECESDSEGAVAFGGGIDVRLTDRINFRAQIDWLKVLEEDTDIATRFTIGISTLLGGR